MSIVVAVKKDKEIVVAADRLETFGSRKPATGNVEISKIRRIGKSTLIANTGWGLYDNLLKEYVSRKKSIKLGNEQDVFRFFMGFWHELREKYSFVNDQCEDKETPFADLDASFLVVTKKKFFHVCGNMSVTEFNHFHAIGSGCDFAIGAMHVLYNLELDAADIARRAVETAIEHNIYCGGAIDVMKP